jgi:signal transduction histidine kinase
LVLEELGEVVACDSCALLLKDGDALRIAAARGWPDEDSPEGLQLNLPESSVSRQVLRKKDPIVVEDVRVSPGWGHSGVGEHICGWVGAPLIVKGKAIGLLSVESCTPGAFSEDDAQLVMAFANHAALAIENARLYHESQQRLRQLGALQEVSADVGDSLDLPTVLHAVAASVLRLVDADDVHVFLYDDEMDKLEFGVGLLRGGESLLEPVSQPRPNGITYSVAREGEPILVNDPLASPLFGPARSSWGMEAIVGLPLKGGNRVVGVLTVACITPHDLTRDEMAVLELLAERAAVAIRHAQLVQQLRQSEKHARDLNEELSQRLEELQHTQTRLVQSEKMAAVGQLVAGVAHGLNNPLTTVIGYAQLIMQSEGLPEQVTADLSRIHDAASQSAEIVRNLLTFARQSKPVRFPTSANEAIKGAMSLRSYQLQSEGIELECELEQQLPLVVANPHRLQEVFLNLMINAEQAILDSQGHGRIVIRSRSTPDAVRLEVEDDGPGIPHDIVDRIFEPFFTTKEVGRGTGLGLSICYGIVQEHEGRIWVESRQGSEGHGTTFFIELPVDNVADGQKGVLAEGEAQQPQYAGHEALSPGELLSAVGRELIAGREE